MKIAFFQNYYTPYRHALFSEITNRGVDVSVVYAHYPEDENRRWKMPNGSLNYTVYQSNRFRIGRQIFFVPPPCFFEEKYDLCVVLDNTPTNLSMILFSFFLKIKKQKVVTWVEHTKLRPMTLTGIYQILTSNILYSISNGIVALSEMSRKYVCEVGAKCKTVILPQATPVSLVNSDRKFKKPSGDLVFGYIGSSDKRKNLESLMSAFKQLDNDSKIIIAGVDLKSDLKEKNVRCIGYVDGIGKEDFYSNIDVLILPSLHEPWGLVVNEAVARGVIPLVSKNCGSSELVKKIDERLVFEPDVDSIHNALKMCCEFDSDAWINFEAKRKKVVEEYSVFNAANNFIKIALDFIK